MEHDETWRQNLLQFDVASTDKSLYSSQVKDVWARSQKLLKAERPVDHTISTTKIASWQTQWKLNAIGSHTRHVRLEQLFHSFLDIVFFGEKLPSRFFDCVNNVSVALFENFKVFLCVILSVFKKCYFIGFAEVRPVNYYGDIPGRTAFCFINFPVRKCLLHTSFFRCADLNCQ